MPVQVIVPEFLRSLMGDASAVSVDPGTVLDVIEGLDSRCPGLRDRLLDDSGLRRYVNVYVGGCDVRYGESLATVVSDGETIRILPAASGGMFLP